MSTHNISATQLLCLALGWQGGTFHQVSEATGLSTNEILDLFEVETKDTSKESRGAFSVETCSLEHNRKINFPKNKGDIDYWRGAARGVSLLLRLKSPIYGVEYNSEERGWI